MLDLVIRNGEVITPQGVGRWTVGVSGEHIAYVGIDDPSMQAGRTIDAKGKIVVPGGIEPHAHLDIFDLTNPDSGRSTLGPEEDTRGMAFGGTTTHLDFCFVEPSMDITKAIEERCARWRGNSFVDYSFHVGLMGALPIKTFDQLADVIKQGFPRVSRSSPPTFCRLIPSGFRSASIWDAFSLRWRK
jgi:dihydropyrimidinase